MPYSLTFEVFTMPLTLNEVMSKHWRTRHKNFETIKSEIAGSILQFKRPAAPLKKAQIYICRYSSGTLDRDNAYFTAKPILDALVREGVLEDDGFDMVKRIDVHQVKIKRGEQRRVIVSLKEL
jgi:Holliday junction resolvase RusA-like endonuclease